MSRGPGRNLGESSGEDQDESVAAEGHGPTVGGASQMVGITSNPTGMGAISLLQASGAGSSGMFNAISGGPTASAGPNIFDTIAPNSANASVGSILQQQKVTNSKNGIFANVAQRLDYIQQGKYQPKSDWEKVAGYAMQTGQPMVAYIDSKGKVQAQPQSEADLSKYNPQQQTKILNAINDIAVMAGKIQGNKTNQGLIDKLQGAESDLTGVFTGQLPPQTGAGTEWESQGVQMMTMNKPFRISLDGKGNLQVADQATESRPDLPADQQKVLQAAAASLPTILGGDGIVTAMWQADAQAMAKSGVPFHLEVDPYTLDFSPMTDKYGFAVDASGVRTLGTGNQPAHHNGTPSIVVKENNGDNIVPTFLKTPPYSDIGDKSPMMKAAADFIQKGKAFFLDFGPTGLMAKEATAQNLIKYNTPTQTASSGLGAGSILSLLA